MANPFEFLIGLQKNILMQFHVLTQIVMYCKIALSNSSELEELMNSQATNISSESYQIIKDEHLAMVIVSSQVLTSSRILFSTYEQVVFSECTFYACDFQGIAFKNCIFENCIFEFSHFRTCNFKNCSFSHCKWKATSSIHSIYESCDLSLEFNALCKNGKNTITSGDKEYSTDIYLEFALAS